MFDLQQRAVDVLVKRTPLLCTWCNSRVVRDIGFLRRRGVCGTCLLVEAAAAAIASKRWQIIGVVTGAAIGIAGIVVTIVATSGSPQQIVPPSVPPTVATVTAAPTPPPEQPAERQPSRSSSPPRVVVASTSLMSVPATPAIAHVAPVNSVATPIGSTDAPVSAPTPEIAQPPEVVITDTGMGVITVTASAIVRGAERTGDANLPPIPTAFRAYVSGRCVILLVSISRTGDATARVLDSGDVNPLFVDAVVRDAVRGWRPAVTSSGDTIDDERRVEYCWK